MDKSETQGFDISGKSAAVIGCGGLGCNIAVHLAGAGIGRIYLCDFDSVSESNLNRQFFYGRGDIGKKKTEAAAGFIKNYAPETEVFSADKRISDKKDLDFAMDCDMIFLAADNNETRKTVQLFCKEKKIPLVNGGINSFSGTVYLYIPEKSPCLDCAGLTEKENRKIKSVSSTAGIIGALEAEIGIKYLLGDDEAAGILHIYDRGEINKLKIKPQESCGLCGVNKNV